MRLLEKLARKNRSYDLIRQSRFGNIPVLILDTCDNFGEAKKSIEKFTKGIFQNALVIRDYSKKRLANHFEM